MKFIPYARASTKDKQRPELQVEELQAWAARNGHELLPAVVETESGRNDARPKWNSVLDRVLAGEADGIVSVELSRFGRSTKHLLQVSEALRKAGRHLVCTRQRIDTTDAMGRLVFTLLAAVAQFEAELTAERIANTIATVRAGRPDKSWGRQRAEVQPEALALAALWLDAGESWRKVCVRLAAEGYEQPPKRKAGRVVRPARPWPTGTLRDAIARWRPVGIPTAQARS